jgi:hypothetical protein
MLRAKESPDRVMLECTGIQVGHSLVITRLLLDQLIGPERSSLPLGFTRLF